MLRWREGSGLEQRRGERWDIEQTASHYRIRHDTIDDCGKITLRHGGRLHHIGVGRTHARTPVIMLIDDLHIRITHATTGALIRELDLDPTRNYQPQDITFVSED